MKSIGIYMPTFYSMTFSDLLEPDTYFRFIYTLH
jgi:hypothetical protein